VLLVEGNAKTAKKVLRALTPARHTEWVTSLAQALERLQHPGIAAILLNLSLPDSEGIETFIKAQAAARHIPIVVHGAAHSERVQLPARKRGAAALHRRKSLDVDSLRRAVEKLVARDTKVPTVFVETARAEHTLAAIADAVLSTDISGNVTYLNAVAEGLTGWSRWEAAGRPVTDILNIINGATRKRLDNPIPSAIREHKAGSLPSDCILLRRDGSEVPIEDSTAPIYDSEGGTTGAVMVFHDVSAARQSAAQISHLAHHDFLTDLPNRMLLDDRLQHALTLAQRHQSRIAVLFLDLDRFKHINDSLGHVIGDQLLQAVAARLQRCVRRSDTVGRRGGDEFLVILSEVDHEKEAAAIAAKLLAVLTVPYRIAQHDLHVPVSIGVSLYPDDGEDAETLINNADTAMYHAKEIGRIYYQFFRREMTSRAIERQFIEGSLGVALERQQFSVQYQPKMDLGSGAIIGVEALLRWRHPQRGFIPPTEFVPIAEDTGLILPIGQWILREACRQSRAWFDDGLPSLPMAVNISALQFRGNDFVDRVRTVLNTASVDPLWLELEITESALMLHAESTVATLNALKALGVRLAVDDFGTGYSSLSYLRQFPVDSLKVDQSFVHAISSTSEESIIVSAMIGMGKSLKKRVLAEGVETREQVEFLAGAGCQEAQGYYFHPPLSPSDFAALYRSRTASAR
jgi:diguanylate cyclase (GGDEF)-like protein/PAS domain S-box-containing protein